MVDLDKMNSWAWIAFIILALLVGYIAGSAITVKVFAKMASGFIDPELVEIANYQFKNNIGTCFPPINFTI